MVQPARGSARAMRLDTRDLGGPAALHQVRQWAENWGWGRAPSTQGPEAGSGGPNWVGSRGPGSSRPLRAQSAALSNSPRRCPESYLGNSG